MWILLLYHVGCHFLEQFTALRARLAPVSEDPLSSSIFLVSIILDINYFSVPLNNLSLEDYYAEFKGICEELNLY